MIKKTVLDASAFLALVNSEKGASKVSQVMDRSVMSTVNACEAISEMNTKLNMPIDECQILMLSLVNEVVDFDLEQSNIAASLKRQTKELGLSLGDRACLALATKLDANVYTADKIWQRLELSSDLKIIVIR